MCLPVSHKIFQNSSENHKLELLIGLTFRFQIIFQTTLCQEDPYFQDLVRYIHLNPVRAKLVKGMEALDQYPYSGHSALMGMVKHEWQDTK
ncbi:MAG: hypothetical protein B5M55_07435, partial [Desulfococcus sp. 4484_242]